VSYKVISEAAKIGKKLIHDTHTQLRHITIEYVGTDDEVKEDGKEVSATVVFVTKLNAWLATRDSQPVLEFAVVVISNTDWGLFEGDEKETGTAPVVAYLAQDPLLPFSWEGLYWPRAAGWQTVRTLQGDDSWWYVWGKDDWRSLREMERMRETERRIARMGKKGQEKAGVKEEGHKELIAKGWFCLLLVLGMFFLWVERKI